MNREEGMRQLAACRDRIDDVDRRLIALLNERTRIVDEIGELKRKLQLPIYEPRREDEVYRNVVKSNSGPLSPEALTRVFERIIDEMRTVQREKMLKEDAQAGTPPE